MQFFRRSNTQPQFFKILTGISPGATLLFFKIMNDFFDLISCYMHKSENDLIFKSFFDKVSTFLALSHRYVHCTEINLNLKQLIQSNR